MHKVNMASIGQTGTKLRDMIC